MFAIRNNKLLVTSATLVATGALLVVTMFAIRNNKLLVTTSKAPVTTSDALVTTRYLI